MSSAVSDTPQEAVTPTATAAQAEPSAAKPLSLRRNFSWTLAGNIVYAGCQWGMLVVLAKLGSPEMVGQFALALAVTAPVVIFFNLQLRAIQATDAHHDYEFGEYLTLRLFTTALSLLVVAVIAYLGEYDQITRVVIFIVATAKAIDAVADSFLGLVQKSERMEVVAQTFILNGLLSLIGVTVALLVNKSLVWATIASVIASFAALLALVGKVRTVLNDGEGRRESIALKWRQGKLSSLARLALPLGIVVMLVSLNASIPRFFIERYLGRSELGIFAAMAYIITVGALLCNALGQSATPRLAKHISVNDVRSYWALMKKLIIVGVAIGLSGVAVAVVAGGAVLRILYGSSFANHGAAFVWLMIAGGVSYIASFLGFGITAARSFQSQMIVAPVVALASLLCSYWMIPSYGVIGAAIAVLVTMMVQLVANLTVILYSTRGLSVGKK